MDPGQDWWVGEENGDLIADIQAKLEKQKQLLKENEELKKILALYEEEMPSSVFQNSVMKGSAVSGGHEHGRLEAEPAPRPSSEESQEKLPRSTERSAVQQLVARGQLQHSTFGLPRIVPETLVDDVSDDETGLFSNYANCEMLNLSVAELMDIDNEP